MRTMNEVFDRYELECVPRLAPETQRNYRYLLATLREHFGERIPAEIKPRDVGRFLDVSHGKQHRNKQVAVLSAVMGKAMGKWYVDGVDSNPCRNVERHESFPRTRYITDAEFWAVHALAKPAMQLMMELALLTGQRGGDLLDLTWPDVRETYIDVVQSKTGKHLGINLTHAVEEVLLRARRMQPMFPRWYVIRTKTGEPYTHPGFRSGWQWLVEKAKKAGAMPAEQWHFHDIRAKCASDMKNLEAASELLGHETTAMTQRVYMRNTTFVDPLR